MRLKICGLQCENDIDIINRLKPDYAGFVFAQSKRRVGIAKAKELIERLDKRVKSVGVFAEKNVREAIKTARECSIDFIQLHGDVEEELVREVRGLCDIKIIKCVRVKSAEHILASIETCADYLLFDTYDQNSIGGTGKRVNLEIIKNIRERITKPFFIAGGINAQNIHEIIPINPFAADVSSGAEGEGGYKDEGLVKVLIESLTP